MTRTQSLEALIAAIVDGDDAEVSSLLRMIASKARDNGTIWPSHDAAKAFHGSLDAAKALHDAVLPGWDVLITTYEDDLFEVSVSMPNEVRTYDGLCEIIARAWLLSILRALLAQEASA